MRRCGSTILHHGREAMLRTFLVKLDRHKELIWLVKQRFVSTFVPLQTHSKFPSNWPRIFGISTDTTTRHQKATSAPIRPTPLRAFPPASPPRQVTLPTPANPSLPSRRSHRTPKISTGSTPTNTAPQIIVASGSNADVRGDEFPFLIKRLLTCGA